MRNTLEKEPTAGLVLAEALQDLVGGPTESLEQDGDALLTLPVDADTDEVTLVDLELQPCTAGRDDLAAVQVLVRGLVHGSVEVHTRGANQLGDDDALGTVDDEGALGGHEWKSPMNTVWLLISPVSLLMNSAVTNIGAE